MWTAPSWQKFSSRLQPWSVQPCVRPLSAAHEAASHNALLGSGPGQKHAVKNAMAHVGCPDCDGLFVALAHGHHGGALTAPTSMALTCRWRSRPQYQKATFRFRARQRTSSDMAAIGQDRSRRERPPHSWIEMDQPRKNLALFWRELLEQVRGCRVGCFFNRNFVDICFSRSRAFGGATDCCRIFDTKAVVFYLEGFCLWCIALNFWLRRIRMNSKLRWRRNMRCDGFSARSIR